MSDFHESELNRQSLLDHLVELRQRLIYSIIAIFLGMVVCYNFTTEIFEIIRAPIQNFLPSGGLIFTAPSEKFIAHLKIAFFSGFVVSCPVWMFHIWKFVSPGLYSKEKKVAVGFIFSGIFLFIVGIMFSYFFVMPVAFEFLMGYGGQVDQAMITIDQYLSFFLMMTLMFGISFELPLILVVLGMFGIVTQKFLKEKRRYAVVALTVMSAVLTPPDIISMVMMLIPMLFLFEISVVLVGFFERKKKAHQLMDSQI